jgi:acetone carboxylase gamma subunit
MTVQKSHYEASLAEYSNHLAAIALLKQYRPYLEMVPSLRRPDESVITIPCDVAILMCDPEWKIKTGAEILVFIHRANEDFSDLLGRWRQTQVWLDNDYEWLMPLCHSHILSEGANTIYPLFVVFSETLERIQRGLAGAELPFVTQTPDLLLEENSTDIFSPEIPPA